MIEIVLTRPIAKARTATGVQLYKLYHCVRMTKSLVC